MSALVRWPGPDGFRCHPDNLPLSRTGCYSITHIASGKRYIGCSHNVEERLRRHIAHSKQNKPAHQVITTSIKAHGNAAFLVEPLYYGIGNDYLFQHEEALLVEDFSCWVPGGYNAAPPAWRSKAFNHSLLPLPQRRFRADIRYAGKMHQLGWFNSRELADAANAAARAAFGAFARAE
jgi:hypothetical protein